MKKFNEKISFAAVLFLIITLTVATICVFAVNIFAEFSNKTFSSYVKRTAETLAYQSAAIIKDSNAEPDVILSSIAKSALHNDKNIMLVEFADINGKVYVVEKSRYYTPINFSGIKINTPLNTEENNKWKTVGYLRLIITDEYINKDILSQKIIIILLFAVIWLIFLFSIFIYNLLINRELKLLCIGLKHISEGHFGTKIEPVGRKQTKELVKIFNDLSLKLKNYEEQNVGNLLIERNKFEAILMSIVNGVIVCDCNDIIVLTNTMAEKILSAAPDVLQGVSIQNYTDYDGNHCFRDKIEEFKDIPLENILNNPPEFTVTINKKVIKNIISPIFMQNGDYVGYITVMIDITKETEVNNLKNQFISNVSHELRTPVTVLRTYLDTLDTMSDDLDEETKKEFISTANKEVTRLHRMVNDILDVSRLEAPDVELKKEDADIVKVLEDTIQSMQVLAGEKHSKIELSKEQDEIILPINVVNIERVFNNLLSNAIKYSPENQSISVELKVIDNCVDISVTDKGIGIDEEHQKKLFERFYRVENSVHTVKGTGLGLYLVKTTVEKHHKGKVYVKSKPGEGSTFGIKIPLS